MKKKQAKCNIKDERKIEGRPLLPKVKTPIKDSYISTTENPKSSKRTTRSSNSKGTNSSNLEPLTWSSSLMPTTLSSNSDFGNLPKVGLDETCNPTIANNKDSKATSILNSKVLNKKTRSTVGKSENLSKLELSLSSNINTNTSRNAKVTVNHKFLGKRATRSNTRKTGILFNPELDKAQFVNSSNQVSYTTVPNKRATRSTTRNINNLKKSEPVPVTITNTSTNPVVKKVKRTNNLTKASLSKPQLNSITNSSGQEKDESSIVKEQPKLFDNGYYKTKNGDIRWSNIPVSLEPEVNLSTTVKKKTKKPRPKLFGKRRRKYNRKPIAPYVYVETEYDRELRREDERLLRKLMKRDTTEAFCNYIGMLFEEMTSTQRKLDCQSKVLQIAYKYRDEEKNKCTLNES